MAALELGLLLCNISSYHMNFFLKNKKPFTNIWRHTTCELLTYKEKLSFCEVTNFYMQEHLSPLINTLFLLTYYRLIVLLKKN